MLLIGCGCGVPLLAVFVLWAWVGRGRPARAPLWPGGPGARHALAVPATLWDGMAREIAQRDGELPRRRSSVAERQRHLALVQPADPRR